MSSARPWFWNRGVRRNWSGACLSNPMKRTARRALFSSTSVGMLGMCGHGTIGLAVTLAHLGRIETGRHRIDTPVGAVAFELDQDGWVSVKAFELPLRQRRKREGGGPRPVIGQIAWGGNWFFLVEDHGREIHSSEVEELTGFQKGFGKRWNGRASREKTEPKSIISNFSVLLKRPIPKISFFARAGPTTVRPAEREPAPRSPA